MFTSQTPGKEVLFNLIFNKSKCFRLFDANLLAVDKGISRVAHLMDSYFNDQKTAFVFTSDHGMTDGGKCMGFQISCLRFLIHL